MEFSLNNALAAGAGVSLLVIQIKEVQIEDLQPENERSSVIP
jgi:hypothetical protein